jgi:plasmid stability protein
MATVQIRNIPEQTHAILRRRAAEAGQSLQEYLRARLVEEAATDTLGEILARAGGRAGGRVSPDEVVAILRADRASH